MGVEEALRVHLVDELTEEGKLFGTAMRLPNQIAVRGSELVVNLKEVASRVPNMDHVGATYYKVRFTNDLIPPLFTKLAAEAAKLLREKNPKALKRLGKL